MRSLPRCSVCCTSWSRSSSGVAVGRGSTWVTALAVLVVAVAFRPLRNRAQAAVDWRFDRPRYEGLRHVRAFVEDVREGRREPEDVGAVLASALRDPSAELLFRLPTSDDYADRSRAVVADPGADERVVTKVEHRGQEIGLFQHAPGLLERPDLLRSVLAAASLAIEIARLRVGVRLQLDGGGGIESTGRAGGLRGAPAARARSS